MQLLLGQASIRTIAECIVHVVRPLLGAALLFGTVYALIDRERRAHEEEMREMMTMPTADALSRYLDLASQQMKLTAANMANIDTPGYRTQGIDFEHEFANALSSTAAYAEGTASDVAGLTSRPDGNNVSVDREGMMMAQTQLQFRTGVELLHHEYLQMLDAIKSDGK